MGKTLQFIHIYNAF